MPLTKTTLEERIQCVRLYSHYGQPHKVQLAWQKQFESKPPSRKTIVAINKKFDATGSVADLVRIGRPKSSTLPANVTLVENALKKDPSMTLRALAEELGMKKTSVQRMKREAEKNGILPTLAQVETRKLKDRISTLNKKVECSEHKSKVLKKPPNGGLRTDLDLNQNTAVHISSKDTFAQQMQVIESSDMEMGSIHPNINSSTMILTPVMSTENGSQILHIAPETFRLLHVQCSKDGNNSVNYFEA